MFAQGQKRCTELICRISALQATLDGPRLTAFNLDLIFLKPARNSSQLPCCHWGGTDHGGRRARFRDGARALRPPQTVRPSLSRVPLPSPPNLLPALALLRKSPQPTFPREAFIKVRIEGYRVKIGWRSSGNRGGGNKLCRDTLARTLPAKFVEEVILLQRRPLPQ